jgi:hypothetical protein
VVLATLRQQVRHKEMQAVQLHQEISVQRLAVVVLVRLVQIMF